MFIVLNFSIQFKHEKAKSVQGYFLLNAHLLLATKQARNLNELFVYGEEMISAQFRIFVSSSRLR
jgi:hypothetical protein